MEFDAAHFITDVFGKYPRLWALKGAHQNTVNRWYKFGALASIRKVAPGFREISELPDWNWPLHKEKEDKPSLERCGKIKDGGPSTKKISHLPHLSEDRPPAGSHNWRRKPSLLPYKRKAQSSEGIIEKSHIFLLLLHCIIE
ncbi:hypothetical protein ACS0TY_026605 [Phlomoides rotata]